MNKLLTNYRAVINSLPEGYGFHDFLTKRKAALGQCGLIAISQEIFLLAANLVAYT